MILAIPEIWGIINTYIIYFKDVINLRYVNKFTYNHKFSVYINKEYQIKFIEANIFNCKGISSIDLRKITFDVKDVEYLSIITNNQLISNRAIYRYYNLKILVCGYHTKLHDAAIMFLDNLEVLSSYSVVFSDYAIQNLKKIKVLKCIQGDFITDNGIKRLTTLTVLVCSRHITDEGLKNLINLKTLYLHENTKITDTGLSYLINLTHLYCGNNTNITKECIKKLSKLNFLHCGKNKNLECICSI